MEEMLKQQNLQAHTIQQKAAQSADDSLSSLIPLLSRHISQRSHKIPEAIPRSTVRPRVHSTFFFPSPKYIVKSRFRLSSCISRIEIRRRRAHYKYIRARVFNM